MGCVSCLCHPVSVQEGGVLARCLFVGTMGQLGSAETGSHLLLQRRGDEPPQLRETVVDSVSASLLDNLTHENKQND